MIELFEIFKYSFLLCLLAGMTIPLQGAHLVSRKQGLQILALAQAGLIGNLLGKLLFHEVEILTILCSLVFFIFMKILFLKRKSGGESFYIVVYLALMAIGNLLVSIFPGLDSHMSLGLFGDVVSLSAQNTVLLSAFFVNIFALMHYFSKRFKRNTLNASMFHSSKIDYLEELLFSLTFVISIYGLGVLYTVSLYIMPTVLGGRVFKALSASLLFLSLSGAFSSVIGLGLSVSFSNLSTVPSQVVLLLLVLSLGKLIGKIHEKIGSNTKREALKCHKVES